MSKELIIRVMDGLVKKQYDSVATRVVSQEEMYWLICTRSNLMFSSFHDIEIHKYSPTIESELYVTCTTLLQYIQSLKQTKPNTLYISFFRDTFRILGVTVFCSLDVIVSTTQVQNVRT